MQACFAMWRVVDYETIKCVCVCVCLICSVAVALLLIGFVEKYSAVR